MEKNRLKEEQEKRLQDERTKFIEKTKNLLIFEPVEDDKPKRSAPAKVFHLQYIVNVCNAIYTVSGKKKRPRFFWHNFNKCRHSFVIFGVNHHEDSF